MTRDDLERDYKDRTRCYKQYVGHFLPNIEMIFYIQPTNSIKMEKVNENRMNARDMPELK